MIDSLYSLFKKIEEIHNYNKGNITDHDILAALTEELGEYSRAMRVEDGAPICSHKEIKESSKVEIIDLMLICIEAFIHRGGTYVDMLGIMNIKILKWIKAWEKENE